METEPARERLSTTVTAGTRDMLRLLACLDGLDSGLEIGRLVAAEAARRGLAVSHHPTQGVADDGHP